MATSKSRNPSLATRATRSSAPTTSAPAARASAAFSPAANTATRAVRPVPAGSDRVPRTIWSALRGSTPSRMASSTVSSKEALADDFTRSTASAGVYRCWRSISATLAGYFFPLVMVCSFAVRS